MKPLSKPEAAVEAEPGAQSQDQNPPRCLKCFYRLDGLDSSRCPECGAPFDLTNPATFTRRPPFIFWRFWLPGVCAAIAVGFAWLIFLGLTGNVGWGATIGVPFSVGMILGYGVRAKTIASILIVGTVVAAVAASVVAMHPSAAICVVILALIALVPASGGLIAGRVFRGHMRKTNFSQRDWLPLLFAVLFPAGVNAAERIFVAPPQDESITTSVVLPMTATRAFDHWLFYEDVNHEPPLLLRLGLPLPLKTIGQVTKVGDTKICLYQNGRLVKRVTEFEPGKRIAFTVIDQWRVQDHAVKLTGGSFEFTPTADGKCRVTLTTQYHPLLTPRFAWRAPEELITHTLHEHVLLGMCDDKAGEFATEAPH